MKETQRSITAWGDATFGPATLQTLFDRVADEWRELVEAWEAGDQRKAAREAADVYITMVRWLEYLGFDLHEEVDIKMGINRERKWRVTAEGVGQHVKEGES